MKTSLVVSGDVISASFGRGIRMSPGIQAGDETGDSAPLNAYRTPSGEPYRTPDGSDYYTYNP